MAVAGAGARAGAEIMVKVGAGAEIMVKVRAGAKIMVKVGAGAKNKQFWLRNTVI